LVKAFIVDFERRLKKLDMKKGSGEFMGFAICLPLLMMMFCGLVMVTQLGLAKQSLEYAAYSAARTAVVQDSLPQAQNAADLMAQDLSVASFGIRSITTTLEVVSGRADYAGTVRWEKGSLLKTIVTADINTIAPFRDSTLSAEITMMIERPANAI
jgi:Flp pilus assembly protein TadG